jgi:demethylmenaquinone methyltransferase/2-methoxy-6-polyprenyl-1,4-benzoquinol methylase
MPKNNTLITRVTRSKENAKAGYDKMSKWYDLLAGNYEKKYTNAGLDMLNAHNGEKILEIGFGTGHSILTLAPSVGDSGMISGIDLSEGL